MNLPMSFLSCKFIPRMEDVAGAANITAATIQHPFSRAHRARHRRPELPLSNSWFGLARSPEGRVVALTSCAGRIVGNREVMARIGSAGITTE
jgi:hypothetical protein